MGFDLENFPKSQTAKRMMSRVSPIYDKSYVGKWIFEVMGAEIDFAKGKFDELRKQAVPETATWGLKYWEQRYGILTNENQTLEQRRRAVVTRRFPRSPMNPALMEKTLTSLCGRKVSIVENVQPYVFGVYIESDSSVPVDIAPLLEKLKKIKPAHQSYRVSFITDVKIQIGVTRRLYNTLYTLCGTVPDVSRGWTKIKPVIDVIAEGIGHFAIVEYAGDIVKAGTIPKTSSGYVLNKNDIKIMSEGKGNKTESMLTSDDLMVGTFPETSRGYTLNSTDTEIAVEAQGEKTVYTESGTIPKTSSAVSVGNEGVIPEVETVSYGIQYKMCGDTFDI
jgi:hypothetical protein